MRMECDFCFSVFDLDEPENETGAYCPFCSRRLDSGALTRFLAIGDRTRLPVAPPVPFGLETTIDPNAAQPPIVCPPANPVAIGATRRTTETPPYVKAVARVPTLDIGERPPEGHDDHIPVLEEIAPPAFATRRPVTSDYSFAAPPDAPTGGGDTDRPYVHSDRKPLVLPRTRRAKAAVALSFLLGVVGAALIIQAVHHTARIDSREAPAVPAASYAALADRSLLVGDVEQASAALERASKLAPKDPAVLLSRARLAVERADASWLSHRARLDIGDDGARTDDFVRAAEEARSAADEAFRAAPVGDDALRLQINALRIFGELDAARHLAERIQDKTHPESAYTLGTLDLVSDDVPPKTPIDRLGESGWAGGLPGRNRAALAYAFIRGGELESAGKELDKIAMLARPHPAVPDLRALLVQAQASAKPVAGAGPSKDKPAAAKDCCSESSRPPASGKHRDARAIIREAVTARCRGEVDRARRLLQGLLEEKPDDPEALSAMGDLARQQDDWEGARNFYGEALRANASFLPAAIGAADVEWDIGNLSVAQQKYRAILESFPDRDYPPRVKERAVGPTGGSKGSG